MGCSLVTLIPNISLGPTHVSVRLGIIFAKNIALLRRRPTDLLPAWYWTPGMTVVLSSSQWLVFHGYFIWPANLREAPHVLQAQTTGANDVIWRRWLFMRPKQRLLIAGEVGSEQWAQSSRLRQTLARVLYYMKWRLFLAGNNVLHKHFLLDKSC